MTDQPAPARSIPLVDLRAQYERIAPEIDDAIQRVVESARFILGPAVEEFEAAFGEYVRAAGCVGVASGTSALHLSLVACGVGAGDEVITSSHTFTATAEAIAHTGARPVFVDIAPGSYGVDPEAVMRAITPRTRAIVPVHLYGHPADMAPLMDLAERHDLWVVEDAAQAHGAEYDRKRCGAIGHLAAFSFFPGKNLGAYGDAGAVTGNSEQLLARVRKLRDHGRTSKYVHDTIGYGERLDALQAAILTVKLRRLEQWTEARRRIAARYTAGLATARLLELPREAGTVRHVYHLYVIEVERRDDVLAALQKAGIAAGVHYPVPLHRQPAYQHLSSPALPVTERAAAHVLSLPIYPEMSNEDVDYVIEHVRRATST